MKAKPKVSPAGTYILEEDDVDILDGLSITAVLDEATDALAPSAPNQDRPARDAEPADSIEREPTIDELLEEPIVTSEETSEEPTLEDTGTFEALDVLLAPELLFGDSDDEA